MQTLNIMTPQFYTIGALFTVIVGLVGFFGSYMLNKIESVDRRSREIETNYNAKFEDVKVTFTKEIAETRQAILNAMMNFTKDMAKVQEDNRSIYADKEQVAKDLQGLNERIHENKIDIQELTQRI